MENSSLLPASDTHTRGRGDNTLPSHSGPNRRFHGQNCLSLNYSYFTYYNMICKAILVNFIILSQEK